MRNVEGLFKKKKLPILVQREKDIHYAVCKSPMIMT